MSTIYFEGEGPFHLALEKDPTAGSECEDVILVLTASVPGLGPNGAELRVPMAIAQARHLAFQLQLAADEAQKNLLG